MSSDHVILANLPPQNFEIVHPLSCAEKKFDFGTETNAVNRCACFIIPLVVECSLRLDK